MERRRRGNERNDRRKGSGDFRGRPPASPASMLVLMVSGVLLVTAAAAAVLGQGYGNETPHGRLLTTLEMVAEVQEGHYREQGRFMSSHETPPLEVPLDVDLRLLSGGEDDWRALARAPEVGLACSQAGSVVEGTLKREPPICYREEG